MMNPSYTIRLEKPEDAATIEHMQAEAFGPYRFQRAAFKLRSGTPHCQQLSFVCEIGGTIAGSVRLTPITIGNTPAMLLGPLTVRPSFMSRGLGRALMEAAHKAARAVGEKAILLVGDYSYYGPLGYEKVPHDMILMPGHTDADRLLMKRLCTLVMPRGLVRAGRVEDHILEVA